MAKKIYEINGVKYLKCVGCGELKEMTSEFRYKQCTSSTGFLPRCKTCIHNNYGDKDRERAREYYYSHKEQYKSYKEKNKDKIYLYNSKARQTDKYKEYQKRYRETHKKELTLKTYDRINRGGYGTAHHKTAYLIKKLGIRPKICPICGIGKRVEAHHPNYDKRYEITRACNKCHQMIHNGYIKSYEIIDLRKIGAD